MDFLMTPLTAASGTSVQRRNRSASPERVHRALAELDPIMAAFEQGQPEPSAAPALGRAHTLEPSWAPTPSMGM